MTSEVKNSLAWGLGILMLALIASFARTKGWIDHETTTRIVLGATGLMIASFGNRIPKTLAPSVCARQIQRVAGWSLAISGLIYSGLWIFAPVDLAVIGGSVAVITGIAVTFGYVWTVRRRAGA